jgi:hypothetical protein
LYALAIVVIVLALAAFTIRAFFGFPADTTPEGAYLRIASSLGRGDARVVFSYQEDAAQHACYTIRDYRKKASERIASAYPEPEKGRLLDEYRAHASAKDGADVWLDLAEHRGFIGHLRRDLSGIVSVERAGERATIITARGTRYPFRVRANGMWGLTMFTAELTAEAERASRDLEVVERAAADYERARR